MILIFNPIQQESVRSKNTTRPVRITKAAELDSSARIWLCTPQQTPTEALTFLAKNQQLSNAMPMGKQQMSPLEQPILFRSFGRQQTQSKQPIASTTMITSLEGGEMGASVAPGKNTTAGLELMASLEADKIGASVAPGKNHYSGVLTSPVAAVFNLPSSATVGLEFDGVNVLTNSLKNQKASSSFNANPKLCSLRTTLYTQWANVP